MLVRQDSDHPIDRIRFGLMVAIGGEDSSQTLALVKRQSAIAARELAEIPKRAEARGAEFLEFAKESIEDLLSQTKSYVAWLEKAEKALEEQDSSATMEAYEESSDILPQLNAAVDRYTKDFSGYGPMETMPGNTLVRTVEGIAAGEIPPNTWAEYCDYFHNGIAEREKALAALELPGRHLLRHKYGECLEMLEGLRKAAPPSAAEAAAALSAFDQAFAQAEGLEKQIAAASTSDQTPIPATNVLLDFMQKAAGYDADSILSVVEDYGEIMDGYSEAFEQTAARPTNSVLVQEEIPKTLDNLDAHYAAIEDLTDALENSAQAKIPDILNQLKESAAALKESQDVYETANLHQAAIACPSCGRTNPPENRNCEACGEMLPRAEDAGIASSTFSVLSGPSLEENQRLEMTENVARLFQACDDVFAETISLEQFQAEVNRARQGLAEFVEELEGVAATAMDQSAFTEEQWDIWRSQHLPHLEDVALTYQAGIQETEEGLNSMEQFLDEPVQQYLIDGIRITWQGLSAIHRARLSMETYLKMLGDILQEARERGFLTTEE